MPSQTFFRVRNGLGVTEKGLLLPSRVFCTVYLNRQKVGGGGPGCRAGGDPPLGLLLGARIQNRARLKKGIKRRLAVCDGDRC
jgi:hypothetical protein